MISAGSVLQRRRGCPARPTRSGADSKHVHMPVQVGTMRMLPLHYDTMSDRATRTAFDRPVDQLLCDSAQKHDDRITFESRFFNRLRKSASSGEVIKIIFNLTTIILANSRSCRQSWHAPQTYVVFLQNLCDGPEYPLGIEMQAELSNDQTTSSLQ
jgi:hypothetical protein